MNKKKRTKVNNDKTGPTASIGKAKISKLRLIFMTILSAVILTNIPVLMQELKRIRGFRKVMETQIIGYKFAGLEQFTKNIEYIGYYTDKDIALKETSKEFSHAQYILSPTILDFNNLEHEYILLVCSDEKKAWLKMKELNAQPQRRNPYGMILAKRNL
ncbi:MAG: hypothetical protein KC733_09625 [Candidatus Omnitrophica bacterium]|nr:hypothetical protein [Candidatus Omnitrophota bacterium]